MPYAPFVFPCVPFPEEERREMEERPPTPTPTQFGCCRLPFPCLPLPLPPTTSCPTVLPFPMSPTCPCLPTPPVILPLLPAPLPSFFPLPFLTAFPIAHLCGQDAPLAPFYPTPATLTTHYPLHEILPAGEEEGMVTCHLPPATLPAPNSLACLHAHMCPLQPPYIHALLLPMPHPAPSPLQTI